MKNAAQLVEQMVGESLRVKSRFFEENRDRIVETATKLAQVLKSGHKVLFFGNGGSVLGLRLPLLCNLHKRKRNMMLLYHYHCR